MVAVLKIAPVCMLVQALEYLKQTGHVNTYTFTKCLTEQAIAEFHNRSFPVAIVRPSIVASPPSLRLTPELAMLPSVIGQTVSHGFCVLSVL